MQPAGCAISPRFAPQPLVDEHLQKRLIADPFSAGNLARFSKIGRGKAKRDLHAVRTVQLGNERRSLWVVRGRRGGLQLKKIPPFGTRPPLRLFVFILNIGVALPIGSFATRAP